MTAKTDFVEGADRHYVVEGHDAVRALVNRPFTESYVAIVGPLEFAVKIAKVEANTLLTYAKRNNAICHGAVWEDKVSAMITLWFEVPKDADT